MNCIVTAGPTFEPLDRARRLTNFSTGRLGTGLAVHLASCGHQVALFLGEQSTCHPPTAGVDVRPFTTTASLLQSLTAVATREVDAVFHAAAVSDFAFGKVWSRSAKGALTEIASGKYSTRSGSLLAELVPTPKIIRQLRSLFRTALIIGWKYEVEGTQGAAIEAALGQLEECATDACVVNGPAYGEGFALVQKGTSPVHLPGHSELYQALERLLPRHRAARP